MRCHRLLSFVLLASFFAVAFFQPQARCGSLEEFETNVGSIAGISNDGTIAGRYGYAKIGDSSYTPVIYNGKNLSLEGISADGTTMVGWYLSNGSFSSYLITDSGTKPIGSAGDVAISISADGTHIAGRDSSNNAWYWSETTESRVTFSGSFSQATDVSNTGVVVGYSNSKPYAWFTDTNKVLELENLSGGGAYLISSDGSTIVGTASSAFVYWTNISETSSTLVELPTLTGSFFDDICDVNADGSIIVGESGSKAVLWKNDQIQTVEDWLAADGVDISNCDLIKASAVSEDGTMIAGTGTLNGVANTYYLARAGGLISPEQLAQSLGPMGRVGPAVSSMGQLSMNRLASAAGGHGSSFAVAGREANTGLSSGDAMPGRLDYWVIGSVGGDHELSGEDTALHGGMGLSWENGGQWKFGFGIFGDSRQLKSSHGGSQDLSAMGPGVFAVYTPKDTGWQFRVDALWQDMDLRLTRGYANGGGSATSNGHTDAEIFGISGRAQWTDQVTDTVALTPFAEYLWQTTSIDKYTETTGPFPASYDAHSDESTFLRFGLQADVDIFKSVETWAWLAWDHRFQDRSEGLSGSVTGLGAFSFEGSKLDRDWADAGVGASWAINDRLTATSSISTAIGCDDDTVSDITATMGLSWRAW